MMVEETNVENPENETATVEAVATEPAAAEVPVPTESEDIEAEAPKNTNPNMKWYVVHTFSGYENRAQKALQERIKQREMSEFFGDVLVPTETVEEVRGGTRRTSKRKFFPGYMLVNVELNEQTWHLVKNTPRSQALWGALRIHPVSLIKKLRDFWVN